MSGQDWFVLEIGGDGAASLIIQGMQALREEIHKWMCACGNHWDNCQTENVKEELATLDMQASWTHHYPDYPFHSWNVDFEDGYIRVLRLRHANASIVEPLSRLVEASVELAIQRNDLGCEGDSHIDAAKRRAIALDTVRAIQGKGTSTQQPISEWSDVLMLLGACQRVDEHERGASGIRLASRG